MKLIALFITVTLFCFVPISYAQNVGIGTAIPNASAKLHIVDANRGILIPQISIGNVVLAAPVTAPATGLLVYNTNAATIGGGGVGFYYWNGAQWLMFSVGATGDIDFYEVGTANSPNNINDNIYTLGGMAVGVNNPGTHTAIFSNATPAIKLGQSGGFNNAESGRFAFEENVPNYIAPGTYCGFEFLHNGGTNSLTLTTGCTGQVGIVTFTRAGARMGVKTTAPTADLSVNGSANKTGGGTWTVFSDARLKENVSDYKEGLDLIKHVRPVNFSYNELMTEIWGENPGIKGKVYQGVIAQELQKIAPDMVNEVSLEQAGSPDDHDYVESSDPAKESYLEVDPNKFTYALINAVQEQQEIIENQNTEIQTVKDELAELKARLAKIESLLEK